ncbi:MAG: ribonuclease HI [Defluviitaleaceae bacterium]|nr:ribonuclease HI [Defluviitaleaceae bacterium]
MKTVKIYTDGACSGNPGPGGLGVVLLYGSARKELSKGFELTTNNRMEILAAIEGLKALKEPCTIKLYSDSKYLVDAINKNWVKKWQENNWMRNKKDKALNIDLWIKLTELLEIHNVEFIWVKGHADNEENNRCDQLAREAAAADNKESDSNYTEMLKEI